MDGGRVARPPGVWRDRVAGRSRFDAEAAEAAVRDVYRAAGLAPPGRLLWAAGPTEAAEIVAFLTTPPWRLWLRAFFGVAMGAALWMYLAFLATAGGIEVQTVIGAVAASAVLAGLAVVLAAARRIPMPPPGSSPELAQRAVTPALQEPVIGVLVFLLLFGCTLALVVKGAVADPLDRLGVVALAGACGAMPGLFLMWRLWQRHAALPSSLRWSRRARSVAASLVRTRRRAWTEAGVGDTGLRSVLPLLRAYHAAYDDAFLRRAVRLHRLGADFVGLDPMPHEIARLTPPHFDGVEDSAQAALVPAGAAAPAARFADLAFHVDRLFPFAGTAVTVRPPTRVGLDADDRPHSEDRPALAWEDGTRVFAWHGRIVPEGLFDPARPITLARIEREDDPDLRWVMIERYGLGRFLQESGATEIHHDECGQLYRLPQRQTETICAVRVVNHTAEPDGTLREFWLAVPPTVTSARQAVAWTFGLTAEEYDPVHQS